MSHPVCSVAVEEILKCIYKYTGSFVLLFRLSSETWETEHRNAEEET